MLDPFVPTHDKDIDTLLRAVTPHLRGGDTVVDLGSGAGAILCRLARLPQSLRVVGVECSPALVDASRRCFAGYSRIDVIHGDFMELSWADFDVLVMSITRQHCAAVIEKFEAALAAHTRPRLLALFSGEMVWTLARVTPRPVTDW